MEFNMREEKAVAIWFVVLLIVGLLNIAYFFFFSSPFNFNKAEIKINNNAIEERLYFHTNREYHTLYRNFVSKIGSDQNSEILIKEVACSKGLPYFKDYDGNLFTFPNSSQAIKQDYLAYTENNEYGCSFGNSLGFKENFDYGIGARYNLKPQNLFYIKDRHYIKFVIYSPDKHPLLQKGKNFFINSSVITKNMFLPGEYVIAYVPYEINVSEFGIIQQNDFEFDSSASFISKYILIILLFLIPPILFWLLWRKFGREITYEELPETLSFYPQGRKAWEIVAFFTPPFGQLGKNFFPTIMTDFYRRKIIDIKDVGKEIYIKINNYKNKGLDEIELRFIEILEKIRDIGDKKYVDSDGFFNIKKSSGSLGFIEKSRISGSSRLLAKTVEKKCGDYIEKKGTGIFTLVMIALYILLIISMRATNPIFELLLAFPYLVAGVLIANTTILSRYKKDYYKEYQRWQSFKRYLKEFPSMRDSPPKAVVLWEQYLVYATALGVSAVVLKKLKDWGIAKGREYDTYAAMPRISTAVSSGFASAGASGGGMGGAGGGGVGGGGGGGR